MRRGHVPIRTCVGCRRRRPKGEMVRLGTGRVGLNGLSGEGRGTYLCPDASCIRNGLSRADVRKRVGGVDVSDILSSLPDSADAQNRLDGPHTGRVICRECHGGGPFG